MSISTNSAADKAAREVRVFSEFVAKSGLQIDPASVESRAPPEPDIRCALSGDGDVAFELVEFCNAELAKDVADQRKRGTKPQFHFVEDSSEDAFLRKIAKSYQTDVPTELLCYTGRAGVSDDVILASLRALTNMHGLGPFRRVWFLGQTVCKIAG